jgi:hypothetical protein
LGEDSFDKISSTGDSAVWAFYCSSIQPISELTTTSGSHSIALANSQGDGIKFASKISAFGRLNFCRKNRYQNYAVAVGKGPTSQDASICDSTGY